MTYTYAVVQDGITYEAGAQVPDLGSWQATRADGKMRKYEGKSMDVHLLPTYVQSGSSALCLDTGELYKFDGNEWIKL